MNFKKIHCTLYYYLEFSDLASITAIYVVPNSTGMQESSAGVSPGTKTGCVAQDSVEENTLTINCKGTLLSGVWSSKKSSTCNATAYKPAGPLAG